MGSYSEWSDIIIAAIATSCLIWLGYLVRKELHSRGVSKRLPPGPRGWPVVGSLLSLGAQPHRSFQKLTKRYGPVVYMYLGCQPTILVSSPEMAKEFLKTNDHVFVNRPHNALSVKTFSYEYTDIMFATYGHEWRHMRKICTQQLLNPSRLLTFKGMRQRELTGMINSVLDKSKEGKSINLREFFTNMTLNNITQMMMNESFFGGDGVSEFSKTVRQVTHLVGNFNIADFIPSLSPLDLQGYNKRIADTFKKMDHNLESIVQGHRKKLSSSEDKTSEKKNSVVDFVDVLLTLPRTDEADPVVTNNTIKSMFQDMLIAGSDTTSTLLEWIFAELLKNPILMTRVQEELESVVGSERLVEESDIPQLKYLQAVVKEGLRLHPSAPLFQRESPENSEIGGYLIPGGVQIVINIWAIQRDPEVWERPLEFDPDRFLNAPTDFRGQHFSFFPFGAGRRICPGMNLAVVFAQFALAQLIQNVTWSLPPEQTPENLDMSEFFGLTLPRAIPLSVMAKPRMATCGCGSLVA